VTATLANARPRHDHEWRRAAENPDKKSALPLRRKQFDDVALRPCNIFGVLDAIRTDLRLDLCQPLANGNDFFRLVFAQR
jgi:hypothetical protein